MRSLRLAIAIVPVAAVLAACGGASTPAMSADKLQSQLESAVAKDLGVSTDEVTVTCDGEIVGIVGKTQRCAVSGPPGDATATVTVTAVQGTDISVDYVFDK